MNKRPQANVQLLRSLAAVLLLVAPTLLAPTCAPLDPVETETTVGDFVLTVQRSGDALRTGRTEAQYQYSGELENTGTEDATDVIVYVSVPTNLSGTTVLDPVLVFGDVPAGQTVSSQDTYTISQNRTKSYDPTDIEYQVAQDALPPMIDFAGTIGTTGGMVDARQGLAVLEFPAGAVTEDTDIRMSPLAGGGLPGMIPGTTYDFGPDGASFAEPVTLTIRYDDTDFPAELDEAALFIAKASPDSGGLEPLVSTVDTDQNTITAQVSGFSTYGMAISCIPGVPLHPYCPPTCTNPPPVYPDDPGGQIDTSFGTNGFLTFPLGIVGSTGVSDVVLDEQGRILIGASELRMAVIRVLPDGEGLDPTFGTNGVAQIITQSDSTAASMALRNDGRIVLHGVRQPAGGGLDLQLLRLLPDGVPDPSFGGGDGLLLDLRVPVTAQGQVANLPDGRIFVSDAGARTIFQFLEDGSPDPSFGVDGISTNNDYEGRRHVRRPTGDWLLSQSARARLVDAAGNNVQLFPSNGRGGGVAAFVESPGGGYVLGGTTSALIGEPTDLWVSRIQPSDDAGALEGDDCFGTLASTRLDIADRDAGLDLAVQADGRIVVVGAAVDDNDDYEDEVIVVRFRPDGALDGGFGTDGVTRLDFGGRDTANAVAIDSQGRIIVVGSSSAGTGVFDDRVGVVTRLLP